MPRQFRRRLDFANGDHVGGGAEGAAAGVVLEPDGVEGAGQHGVELLANAVEAPAIILQVLDPLEITHRHAAGVGQNVGQNLHATVVQDFVGVGIDGGVGRLDDYRGANCLGVLLGDHAAK